MFWHVVGSQLPDGLEMCSKEERAKRRIAIFPLSIWAETGSFGIKGAWPGYSHLQLSSIHQSVNS